MAVATAEPAGGTLARVADETTGQRIKRLRDELRWTQKDLSNESGVSLATITSLENDRPGKKGERVESLRRVMDALDRGHREGAAGPTGADVDRQIIEVLTQLGPADHRVTRMGKARWISALVVPPGTSDEEIAAMLEDMHRRRREGDQPNG
jgi:transcriptional regulator with XRE-family HTH domain